MFFTARHRVERYVAKGWWGSETVDMLFQRGCAERGGALALVDPPNRPQLDGESAERLSWTALQDRVERLCAVFLDLGIRKDDVICVQLPNTVDAVITLLAAARLGLIISPVVMQYREHELGHILQQTQPAAFIAVPMFRGHDHVAMGARLAASTPGIRLLSFGNAADAAVDLREAMLQAESSSVAAYVAAHPTDAAEVLTICWTSGTESRAKGVPRDHNHWILNARVMVEAAGMRAGETLLNPFPLVNIGSIGGLVLPWLWGRGVLVLHHPFDLGVFLSQIAEERVNYTIAAPAILTALLKQPALMQQADLSSLRAIGSGSAPLSPWLIETFARDHTIEVCNIFGSNEGCSLFSGPAQVPDHAERARYFPRFGATDASWPGLAATMVATRLVDPATEEDITTPGRPGELRLDGPTVFSGYWRAEAMTRASFDANGYFRTGDLFEIAGEGDLARFYRFVGRHKEIIVRGGVNISPAEIDDLLVGHPMIREAAVVGIPDPDLGERMAIGVVPNEGATPTLADVTSWLGGRGVAVFKQPERLAILDALPRNAMNKVMRADLRRLILATASNTDSAA